MIKEKIEQDIKAAMLGGDKARAEVLRGLKSAILYEEVAKGAREQGLSDDDILAVVSREVKKRAESAEIYKRADAGERAETELAEKAIIEAYLPEQLSDEELAAIVDEVMDKIGSGVQMGQVIGAVRQQVGSKAEGGRIAAAVKAKF